MSELNIKVNQMLDSRIYVMRACAQPVFFLLLDFIFGELDTCVTEAGGHKGETAAHACRLALVGPHAHTPPLSSLPNFKSPHPLCLDNLEARFEYTQSHLVQEEYKIYFGKSGY